MVTKYLYKLNRNDDNTIQVPQYFELLYVYNKVFFCCKIKSFAKYMLDLKLVDDKVNMNLDLVQFVRRIRMHGAALTMLLKNVDRGFIHKLSKKKNVEEVEECNSKGWNGIENLTFNERIARNF